MVSQKAKKKDTMPSFVSFKINARLGILSLEKIVAE